MNSSRRNYTAQATLWVGILPEEMSRHGDKPEFQVVHHAFHEGEDWVELGNGLRLKFISIPDPTKPLIHMGLGLPISKSVHAPDRLQTFSQISLKYALVHAKVKEALLLLGVQDPDSVIQTFIVPKVIELEDEVPPPSRNLLT